MKRLAILLACSRSGNEEAHGSHNESKAVHPTKERLVDNKESMLLVMLQRCESGWVCMDRRCGRVG